MLYCHFVAHEKDERPPEFLQSLQITKTRAGMQFSCASLTEPDRSSQAAKASGVGDREVWVCNSDGYVGHMCLLSLQTEPIVTLNTPVPGCNSRITCICATPPAIALQPQQPSTPARLRYADAFSTITVVIRNKSAKNLDEMPHRGKGVDFSRATM